MKYYYLFQSTPPMQGATGLNMSVVIFRLFQSTPPMQGATIYFGIDKKDIQFQSTPPMQGATMAKTARKMLSEVSIHAPYAGSDGDRVSGE